jgi:hypothetical protein
MCDQCLDILADGIKQGREQMRAEIIEILWNHDNGYDWHIGCRLCEVMDVLNGMDQ